MRNPPTSGLNSRPLIITSEPPIGRFTRGVQHCTRRPFKNQWLTAEAPNRARFTYKCVRCGHPSKKKEMTDNRRLGTDGRLTAAGGVQRSDGQLHTFYEVTACNAKDVF